MLLSMCVDVAAGPAAACAAHAFSVAAAAVVALLLQLF